MPWAHGRLRESGGSASQSAYAADVPDALVWATDFDVLPLDRIVERRDGYVLVRSPSNPTHYWGNLLLFPEPPGDGDGARWEAAFEAAFVDEPAVRHRTVAWDASDGSLGRAQEEFLVRGYELEQTVGLIATPSEIRPNARENRDVEVRSLVSARGHEEELWEQVVELQVAGREEGLEETRYRMFRRRRMDDLRALFELGRGAWYVALSDGEVVGSCGVVVTGGRGRFQAVDTAEKHRRRGICSRLVVEAARRAAEHYRADRLVITADPGYHALGLYESLGFERRELVSGVCRRPH
jgi:ribosomal protein S18 acetylase RimI-like enzyme